MSNCVTRPVARKVIRCTRRAEKRTLRRNILKDFFSNELIMIIRIAKNQKRGHDIRFSLLISSCIVYFVENRVVLYLIRKIQNVGLKHIFVELLTEEKDYFHLKMLYCKYVNRDMMNGVKMFRYE